VSASGRIPDGTRLYLGDGGLETTMIFERGIELPDFAAFTLLESPAGIDALRDYYRGYLEIARRNGVGFTLDTPTWRASSDWGERLGYSAAALADVNRRAVELVQEIREAEETAETPISVCGTLGPRGDAYAPEELMSAEGAERYHAAQIETFAAAGVDMVGVYTLAYADEGVGIARAAAAAGVPAAISFTLETDGRLPSGEPLDEAIERVDAETGSSAAYFMINCAHPSHFAAVVEAPGPWIERVGGIRANASRRSHQELDEAPDLDSGDPAELAEEYRALKDALPGIRVLGGCFDALLGFLAGVVEFLRSVAVFFFELVDFFFGVFEGLFGLVAAVLDRFFGLFGRLFDFLGGLVADAVAIAAAAAGPDDAAGGDRDHGEGGGDDTRLAARGGLIVSHAHAPDRFEG
jgi:homocysteine S-methyltransferase